MPKYFVKLVFETDDTDSESVQSDLLDRLRCSFADGPPIEALTIEIFKENAT